MLTICSFEEGNNHSLLDTKLLKLVESQKLMNERMGPLGEKKLFASFKFIYGNEGNLVVSLQIHTTYK